MPKSSNKLPPTSMTFLFTVKAPYTINLSEASNQTHNKITKQ